MVHFINDPDQIKTIPEDGYELHLLGMQEYRLIFEEKGNHEQGEAILVFYDIDTEFLNHCIAFINAWMLRQYHPKKLIYHGIQTDMIKALHANAVYAKGSDYQKIIEPWRYQLSDLVFDEEGYIINQGMMKQIPFGWFTTMEKGCGWIAAYNLLKANGKEVSMEECAHGLEKNMIFGKVMGQECVTLCYWLLKQGLKVKMTIPGNTRAIQAMQKHTSGILLYQHSKGAHYVTWTNQGNGRVLIYNAVYGRRNYVISAKEFIENTAVLPLSIVIYTDKKEKK